MLILQQYLITFYRYHLLKHIIITVEPPLTATSEERPLSTLLKVCGEIHTKKCGKALSQISQLLMCSFSTVIPVGVIITKHVKSTPK